MNTSHYNKSIYTVLVWHDDNYWDIVCAYESEAMAIEKKAQLQNQRNQTAIKITDLIVKQYENYSDIKS